jgi:5'-nucleotidase
MKRVHLAIGLAALIAFAAAAPASARSDNRPEPRTIDVQLLAFNDFHGNLLPPPGGVIRTSNNPVTSVPAGGVEYFATHMKTLEAENPKNTLTVSGGDMIGASPLLSGLFHDEPTIEAMNLIGVDYNGVGNHEFDEGKAELLRMQNGGCHPVDGCQDGTPFFGSVFQFLAANVIDNSTNNPLLPAFKIERIQGVKIAFIGETLEGTPLIVTPAGVQGLTFLDEADTVNMLVPRLREKGSRRSSSSSMRAGSRPATGSTTAARGSAATSSTSSTASTTRSTSSSAGTRTSRTTAPSTASSSRARRPSAGSSRTSTSGSTARRARSSRRSPTT